MKLREWLTKNHKSQKWLAKQLGVTEGRVSQAFRAQREGCELPRAWINDILEITHGEVQFQDEWPTSRNPERPRNANAA